MREGLCDSTRSWLGFCRYSVLDDDAKRWLEDGTLADGHGLAAGAVKGQDRDSGLLAGYSTPPTVYLREYVLYQPSSVRPGRGS
jgi:hypothetical protein